MSNIKKIPVSELEEDLDASYRDISTCAEALRLGITHSLGGSVAERLDDNTKIVQIIKKELERRKSIKNES